MKKITIAYNGNPNLPSDRNHKVHSNYQQLTRTFTNLNKAVEFWLECNFYGGTITRIDEFVPQGYKSPLREILEEKPLELQEVLLPNQELLYSVEEDNQW